MPPARILPGTLSMAELLSAIVICTSIPTKPADMPTAYGANNHGSIVRIGEDWYIFITGIPIIPGTADRDVLKSCRLCRTAVFHR